jgi:Na+-transporting methylmalonyl-CoA/oxaloacetate decarboxylase gamma subunit
MMLENQIIGITGVFVLTFFLIMLYHLMGKFGPRGMRYRSPAKQVNRRVEGRWPRDLKKARTKTMPGSYGALNSMSERVRRSATAGTTEKQKGL